MSVYISMHLWGKPGWMLDEGEPAKPDLIRETGEWIGRHTTAIAAALEKLISDGWYATVTLYDVDIYHPEVKTEKQAQERFEKLGLDVSMFNIHEEEDDCDDCDDCEDCGCDGDDEE